MSSELKWYALQCLSNHEDKVKRYLSKYKEEDEEFCNSLKEVLVPIETVSEVKNGKKKQRDRKFYPGYVFVEMILFDDQGNLKKVHGIKLRKQMESLILSARKTLLLSPKMKLAEFLDKLTKLLEKKYLKLSFPFQKLLRYWMAHL